MFLDNSADMIQMNYLLVPSKTEHFARPSGEGSASSLLSSDMHLLCVLHLRNQSATSTHDPKNVVEKD